MSPAYAARHAGCEGEALKSPHAGALVPGSWGLGLTLGTFLLLGGLEGAPLFFLCGEDELQQQAQVGRARGAHAKLS